MSGYEILSEPARTERFWAGVSRSDSDGCWPWTRAVNSSGYGVVRVGRDILGAHVASWMLHAGADAPLGMVVDHLCKTRLCCNPQHLEIVTQRENVRRGDKHLAGRAPVVRVGPSTIRQRGARAVVIWREYLADGKVRQCGRTFDSPAEAAAWTPQAL